MYCVCVSGNICVHAYVCERERVNMHAYEHVCVYVSVSMYVRRCICCMYVSACGCMYCVSVCRAFVFVYV